jgi:thioredoxin-like negative regulator of GroEL
VHASHNLEAARQEFLEAQRLYADRQYGAALEILDALDKQYPASKNILFARAHCLAQLFRTVEAVKICDRILARYEFPEARELKMQLIKSDGMPPSVNLESSVDLRPMDLGLDIQPRSHSGSRSGRRRPRWHWALAGCVILAIAGLVLYAGMTLLGS